MTNSPISPQEAAQELLRRRKARNSLIDFVQYVKQDYVVSWHHQLTCQYLDRWIAGEIKNLMIFEPPQHGKSGLTSRMAPSYILGKNPKEKIVLASYSASLASSFNRDCQRIIDSNAYHSLFPDTVLNESNVVTIAGSALRNSEIFEVINHGGFLKTVGIGGSLTGTPADKALIDDPVKDYAEAISSVVQAANWQWYTNVLKTRLHNNSQILLTMTRWDVNDLAGKILKAEPGEWTVLVLPGIREDMSNPEDPRKIGEALWPERHSAEKLLKMRKTNSRTYQSLIQQDPKPTETGGEFYKSFNVATHVRDVAYDPELPLHISFDENVNPYLPCGVFQIDTLPDGIREVRLIEEFCYSAPRNKLKTVCAGIVSKYHNQLGHEAGCFVGGDATSQKADVKLEDGHDLFRLAMEYLKPLHPQRRTTSSNPSVVMRGQFMNAIFEAEYGKIRIVLDSKCTNAINDFAYTKEDSDGKKMKETGRDEITNATYQKYGHMSDLTDYLICLRFGSEYEKFKRGGKLLPPKAGKHTSRGTY